jgi:patatin-like phospholipase/acyl hydrolase
MKRLLSIDGGGIRGIIPATILVELEKRAGIYAGGLFDMVAGTSTGGIIACGLSIGLSAQTLLDLYVKRGTEIFTRSTEQVIESGSGITGPKYDAGPLENILKDVLGEKMLSQTTGPHLLVPTYCQNWPGTLFFKSWHPAPDFRLCDVARCTSAAETYFPAAIIQDNTGLQYVCTDGGTFANNPAMAVLADARKLWPGEKFQILSLGTGGNPNNLGTECADWGILQWAKPISNVFMDGSADTVLYYIETSPDADVTRIDIDPLPSYVDPNMDAVANSNIEALRKVGASLIAKHSASLNPFTEPLAIEIRPSTGSAA